MKVTYLKIIKKIIHIGYYLINDRLILENLHRDKKINVDIYTWEKYLGTLFNDIVDDINDIVMLPCVSHYDLKIVADLLKKDKKVIIGGPLILIYGISFTRRVLSLFNINHNNLIICDGFVDLSTDFYSIIKNWKDIKLIGFRTIDIHRCKKRYEVKAELRHLFIGFNTKCFWNKCKFCTRKRIPPINYDNSHVEKSIEEFKVNSLFIFDDFFLFTESQCKILDSIDIRILIYSGILKLVSRDNYYNLNKYVNVLCVGIESCCDYSLNAIQKGYNFNHIKKAIDNIINYLDRNIKLIFNFISDLPVSNVDEVNENYSRIYEIKKLLNDNGFENIFFINQLDLGVTHTLLTENHYQINNNIDDSLTCTVNSQSLSEEDRFSGFLSLDKDIGFLGNSEKICRLNKNDQIIRRDYKIINRELLDKMGDII